MDGWLGFNGILSTQVAAVSYLSPGFCRCLVIRMWPEVEQGEF